MNRNKYLATAILIIWCIFATKMVILQSKQIFKNFLKIYSLNLEKKYELVDGNFYRFMKFCKTKVPERESIIFRVLPDVPDFQAQDWITPEYFMAKSTYYLYPRKVFREKDGIMPDIKYKIIYDINSKIFTLQY